MKRIGTFCILSIFCFDVYGKSCLDLCSSLKKGQHKGSAWKCELSKADIYAALRVINNDRSQLKRDKELIENPLEGFQKLIDDSPLEQERFAMAFQAMRVSSAMTDRFGSTEQCNNGELGIPSAVSEAEHKKLVKKGSYEAFSRFAFGRTVPTLVNPYLNAARYNYSAWLQYLDPSKESRKYFAQYKNQFDSWTRFGAHYNGEIERLGLVYSKVKKQDQQFLEKFFSKSSLSFNRPFIYKGVDLNNSTVEWLDLRKFNQAKEKVVSDAVSAVKKLLSLPNPGTKIKALMKKPKEELTCEEGRLIAAASALFSYASNPLTGTDYPNITSKEEYDKALASGKFAESLAPNVQTFDFTGGQKKESGFKSLRPLKTGGEAYRVHALAQLGFDGGTVQDLFGISIQPSIHFTENKVCDARNSVSPDNCKKGFLKKNPVLAGIFDVSKESDYYCNFSPSRPSFSATHFALPDYSQFSDIYNVSTGEFVDPVMCNALAQEVLAYGCGVDQKIRKAAERILARSKSSGPVRPSKSGVLD